MIKNKEKWIYLLIGTGSGIVLSGILMVGIYLIISETLWEYKQTAQEAIQKLQMQVELYENINRGQADESINTDQQQEVETVVSQENGNYIWVDIPSEYGSTQIAKFLEEKGIVDSRDNFHEYIKVQQKTTQLQTGDKFLPIKGDYKEILGVLLGKNE